MNRKQRMIFKNFLLLLLLTGCSDELVSTHSMDNTVMPDERVVYALYTDTPPIEKPITRIGTANENDMKSGDFWVFVFDNTGVPANPSGIKLLEVAQAEATTSAAPGPYKWMTKLKTRNHPVKVLLIANAPMQVYTADGAGGSAIGVTAFPVNMTYANVLDKLYTNQLNTSVATVPYTNPMDLIPMIGVENFASLTANTHLGTESTPLNLPRLTAKITVDNITPVASSSFVLVGVNLHGAPASSCLAPRTTVTSAAAFTRYEGAAGNETTGIASAAAPNPADPNVKQSTGANPLYCYEANEVDTPKLFLIVQGTYKGEITYYKISIDRATDATPITSIRRNTHYRILLKECTAAGYDTYAEAIAAPPSNTMKYGIEVTDLSSHEILDNGQYFIGVDASNIHIYSHTGMNSAILDVPIFTLIHNAPAEVTLRSITGTAGISAITAFPTADTPTIITATLASSFTNGSITIRLGNLSKTITVFRRQIDSQFLNVAFLGKGFHYAYYQGAGDQTWHSLTTSDQGSLHPSEAVSYGNLNPTQNLYITIKDFVLSWAEYHNSNTLNRTATIRLFGNGSNTVVNIDQPATL